MKQINNEIQWIEIEMHLNNQIRNINVLEALKYFLDLGFDEAELSIFDNPELELLDKWQAYVAVLLSINKVCLEEEKYEIMILIRRAFEKQNRIIRRLFSEEKTPVEETLWELEFTQNYFYATLQSQVDNLQNNNKK